MDKKSTANSSKNGKKLLFTKKKTILRIFLPNRVYKSKFWTFFAKYTPDFRGLLERISRS